MKDLEILIKETIKENPQAMIEMLMDLMTIEQLERLNQILDNKRN